MKRLAIIAAWLALVASVFAGDSAQQQAMEHGKQQEQRSCIPCHSLRLVTSQRLSKAAWEKEIDKMMGWGAPVTDRQALLDYLSEEYSTTKPMPPDEFTGNGAKPRSQSK
jgi:mono/diheme cytochrome c family protein